MNRISLLQKRSIVPLVPGEERGFGGRAARVLLIVLAVGALALPPLSASGQLQPLNDLLSLGQGGGQTPASVPVQKPAAPPMDAAPRANC